MELVAESRRKFLSTLWNTYSFFVIYANIDKFDPKGAQMGGLSELDRWIASELNSLIEGVTDSLERYDPTTAGHKLEDFVDELSNWYVRRSRRRFWKSENDADKQAAHATLHHCLVTLSKLIAPFTPFIAEELFQNLVRSFDLETPESVHLADFPVADRALIDKKLSADMKLAMKVSSLGRAARSKAGLKVRQPLAKAIVKVGSEGERGSLERVKSQLVEELNVKRVDVTIMPPVATARVEALAPEVDIDTDISPQLADEGTAREIVRRIQTMRKQADFDIADYIETYYQGGPILERVMEGFAPYIRQETLSRVLTQGAPPDGAYVETHKLAGEEVILGVRK
jgi:isoleucyl-tRNA synthetase